MIRLLPLPPGPLAPLGLKPVCKGAFPLFIAIDELLPVWNVVGVAIRLCVEDVVMTDENGNCCTEGRLDINALVCSSGKNVRMQNVYANTSIDVLDDLRVYINSESVLVLASPQQSNAPLGMAEAVLRIMAQCDGSRKSRSHGLTLFDGKAYLLFLKHQA